MKFSMNPIAPFLSDIKSGQIATRKVGIATTKSIFDADPYRENLVSADSIAQTQKFLDKAIVLAWKHVKSNRRPPALTRTRWVWRLAGAYHSACNTTRLMEQAAQNFATSGRKSLAQWATQKAREEAGHDRLALLDIQSMGYDAEAVVRALVPPAIKAWLDYFIQSVQTSDPIDCIGHSYASERLGTFIGEKYIHSVQALLAPGTNATRWLRVHSAAGSEVEHVQETVEIVAMLDPQERNRVAKACYETSLLRFSPPKEDYISDEELERILKPLELNTCYEFN